MSDAFARMLLCTSDVLGPDADLSGGNFQLPLLLDRHEQILATPSYPPCTTLLCVRFPSSGCPFAHGETG